MREIEWDFEKVKFKKMADRYRDICKKEGKQGFRELTDEVAKEFLRMGPPDLEEWCRRWKGHPSLGSWLEKPEIPLKSLKK